MIDKIVINAFVGDGTMAEIIANEGTSVGLAADPSAHLAGPYLTKFGHPSGAVIENHLGRETEIQRSFSDSNAGLVVAHQLPSCRRFIVARSADIRAKLLFPQGPAETSLLFGAPKAQAHAGDGTNHLFDAQQSEILTFARLIAELKPDMYIMDERSVRAMAALETSRRKPVIDVFADLASRSQWQTAKLIKRSLLSDPDAEAAYEALLAEQARPRRSQPRVTRSNPQSTTFNRETEGAMLDIFNVPPDDIIIS